MNATAARRRHIRTAGLAAVVGLGVMGAGPGAVAADDILPPPVLLVPGASGYADVVVDDEAVYVQLFNPGEDPAIYRRPMTTSPAGITLGPVELVGRGALDGSIAAHDGTLAYARAVDGRLVLRAADGTETVSAWSGTAFARGIGDLTTDWVVATTLGSFPRLLSRATGAEVDLAALTPNPGGQAAWNVQGIEVTDGRVLWAVLGHDPGTYWGVFTSAMDASGPTGPVVALEEHVCLSGACPGAVVWDVDVVGDAVAWLQVVNNDVIAVRALAGPPYDAEPGVFYTTPDAVASFTGVQVVTEHHGVGFTDLAWHDLLAADPGVPVRTLRLSSGGYTVRGTLIIGQDGAGGVTLQDALVPVTADPTPAPRLAAFSDVPHGEFSGTGFSGQILWLADRGIVGGYPDGTFRGLAAVNRDAMAAFLYRVAHADADAPACGAAPFTDVPLSHPFCGEIAWLASTGITTGWPDGTFRPSAPVTREAMAAFLHRFAEDGDAPACTVAPFTDVAVDNPFCGEVAWLASTGITTGWPDGTFRPAALIERQAMAAFLFRFIDAGLVPTA